MADSLKTFIMDQWVTHCNSSNLTQRKPHLLLITAVILQLLNSLPLICLQEAHYTATSLFTYGVGIPPPQVLYSEQFKIFHLLLVRRAEMNQARYKDRTRKVSCSTLLLSLSAEMWKHLAALGRLPSLKVWAFCVWTRLDVSSASQLCNEPLWLDTTYSKTRYFQGQQDLTPLFFFLA